MDYVIAVMAYTLYVVILARIWRVSMIAIASAVHGRAIVSGAPQGAPGWSPARGGRTTEK